MNQNRHCSEIRLYEEESSPDTVRERFGLHPNDIIDFSVNVNPLGPPPILFDDVANAIKAAGVYPDLKLKDLRALLSARHGLDGNCFVFGAGLDDVLKLISQAWLGPRKAVLIHIPTFPRYELEAQIVGATPVFVRSSTPWAINCDAIANAIDDQPIAVAYLCTPNNPTGAVISNSEIEELAARNPLTTFVVDEALADPSDAGAIPLIRRYANIVVLRTFSKYFGLAGLRVGYAAGQPDVMASLTAVRPPFNVSGLSAKMAISALRNDTFLEASRRAFKQERAYVIAQLAKFPSVQLRGFCSNMLIVSIEDWTAAEFVDTLAAQGIVVVDATSFRGLEGVPSVRISLRNRSDNARLIEAIANIDQQHRVRAV